MKLKQFNFLFALLMAGFSTSQNIESSANGEAQLLLSGDWKFHTIFGVGSNYNTISKTADDIVIDNADVHNVVIKGDWELKTEGARESTFFNKDYLQRSFDKGESDRNYVRFTPNLPQAGFYEAFVQAPFASHLTAQAGVKHAQGTDAYYLNQRSRCGQWLSLGIFNFDKDQGNYIEITAITAGQVAADAVMFRPVSKQKIEEAKEEKATVFRSDFDDNTWDVLKVPGHWGMLNTYSHYTGKGWYRKKFTLPKDWRVNSKERIRLKFDAVYHVAKVFLNGKLVGNHQGGFTPFEFDVTDKINFNGPNVIALEADNSALVGATWNWGGIIRDVHLIKNNDVRISYQYIHADPNLETGSAQINLKLKIENSSSEKRTVQLTSNISEVSSPINLKHSVTIPANSIQELKLVSSLPAKDVRLWHFDFPNLYHINTVIRENGQLLHSREDRFGIRKVTLTDSQFLLNGEPVRLAGFNRVSDHRYWGSSEPQYLIDQDVDLMKNAGANFTRIMHGTQNKKLIERCDEKGILIFEEVNVRELTNPEFNPPHYPLAKKWLKEMIDRDINHPSIVGWSVGNELKDHFDYAQLTIDYVKNELDPYRLVTCVSNSGWRESATPENDPNTLVDMVMHNHYPFQGSPAEVFKTLRSKWPDKPVFISEYGIKPMATTALDGDITEASTWNNNLRNKNTFIIGASLWTYNDYRSGYAATSPEENRVWGLVNAWRQKRPFYDRMQNEHSPLKHLSIDGVDIDKGEAQISLAIKSADDYPSYSLREYSLEWSLYDQNGKPLIKERTKMPLLNPGDGPWKETINWKPQLNQAARLSVRLLSPNGYERAKQDKDFKSPVQPTITAIETARESVRIHYDEIFNAAEYVVRYSNGKNEGEKRVKKGSPFITIQNLVDAQGYTFKVMASNEKGESEPSEVPMARVKGDMLPPVVWDVFVVDDKLVVGYSGEASDQVYTIKYGQREAHLTHEDSTRTRGMSVIGFEGDAPQFVSIKRTTENGTSDWSKVNEVHRLNHENGTNH